MTYPLTRLRGHYFAIATVAIWMIAQPIGATWEFIGGSQGLFIPVKPAAQRVARRATLQFPGPTRRSRYYYAALALFALALWGAFLVERSKLGYYFRAIRDDQEAAECIGIDSRALQGAWRAASPPPCSPLGACSTLLGALRVSRGLLDSTGARCPSWPRWWAASAGSGAACWGPSS